MNLTFKEIIEGKDLTFLVGAGCSVDSPSCLPSGQEMVESLIKHTCAKSEIEKLLDIKNLRLELLLEIIQSTLDPNLKIIDYFTLCEQPNQQHFFIAKMIEKGHFVMTTNYDVLIETALLKIEVPTTDIIPVITKEDFKVYSNPMKLFNQGKKTIYKIHGSTKNMITNEDTRHSLLATIRSLSKRRNGDKLFQIKPYQSSLFENITKDRSLVILGYSGSDDFDVVPSLQNLNNLNDIIWVKHNQALNGQENVFEINEKNLERIDKFDKVNRILIEIYRKEGAKKIYLIETNTSNLIRNLFGSSNIKQDDSNLDLNFKKWLRIRKNIDSPNQFQKLSIPISIYNSFSMYKDKMRCLNEMITLAESENNSTWKHYILDQLSGIFIMFNYDNNALEVLNKALEISKSLVETNYHGLYYNNVGNIYAKQAKYYKAKRALKKALKHAKKEKNLILEATSYHNMGTNEVNLLKFGKALNYYKKARRILKEQGALAGDIYVSTCVIDKYVYFGKIGKAKQILEEIEPATQQLNLPYLEGLVHLTKGNLLKIQRKKDISKDYLLKAKNIFLDLEMGCFTELDITRKNIYMIDNQNDLSQKINHKCKKVALGNFSLLFIIFFVNFIIKAIT